MKGKYFIFNNKTYESWSTTTFSSACVIAKKSAMASGGTVDIDPPYPVECEKVRFSSTGHYTIRK